MTDAWSPVGDRELRVGLIGLGTMGRNHLRVLGGVPGVRLVGGRRPGPAALAAASARSGAQALRRAAGHAGRGGPRRRRHRGADHQPPAAHPGRHRRGHRRPRREAAGRDAGRGRPRSSPRRRRPARRPSRSATSSGSIPPILELGRLLEAGWLSTRLRHLESTGGPVPGPHPRRRGDGRPRHPRRRHPVRDRRRATGPRLGRDRPAHPRRATRTSCSG